MSTSRLATQPNIWYHLTDNPKFKLNPRYSPKDNSVSIVDRSGRPGIYLGKDVERWVNGYGYWRPFVAEIEVDPSVKDDTGVHGKYGGEMFVPAASFNKLVVRRVVPLDAHARERFKDYGWVEGTLGRRFDTRGPIRRLPGLSARPEDPIPQDYRYTGPDARDMSPEEAGVFKKDMQEYRRWLRKNRSASRVAKTAHKDHLMDENAAARVATTWLRSRVSM